MQWCTKIDKYEVCAKVTSFKSQQMIGLRPDNYQIHGLSKESLPCRELLEHLYHQRHQGPASPRREWTEPSPAKAFLSRDFALDMKHLVNLAVVDVHVGHVKQTLACTTWGGRVRSAAARQVLLVQFDLVMYHLPLSTFPPVILTTLPPISVNSPPYVWHFYPL